MTTVLDYLSAEHRQCDEAFAIAEEAAHTSDLAGCRTHFQQFQAAMERHFQKEEQVLFPTFEEATGNAMGPTRVMRLEHQQMRGTLAGMASALADGDLESYLGDGETLLILMQQHNIKEEQMLYPMSDRFLASVADQVIAALQEFQPEQPV
ncbi:MAG: hypothetical protein QG599_234 [Pseudomonadota bacterium]|nr:hypothetical protein [Pseudomonadota bacterium]